MTRPILRRSAVAIAAALYAAGAGASLPWSTPAADSTPAALLHKVTAQPTAIAHRVAASRTTRTNIQRDPSASRSDRLFKAGADNTPQTFIVVLRDQPVASYDGSLPGYSATSPAAVKRQPAVFKSSLTGRGRLDFKSAPVTRYRSYLGQRQDLVLAKAGGAGIGLSLKQRYTNAISGMAVVATPRDAERLAKLPEVRRVYPARRFQLNTDHGPQFIHADQLWNGSATGGTAYQGEGMVAAILDTGINFRHPAFAAVGGDGYHVQNPWGEGVYVGDCASDASLCNDKLIGIHSYPEITSVYNAQDWWSTDDSGHPIFGAYGKTYPENGMDYHGHGSHTASTVAGNVLFDVPLQGQTAEDGHGRNTSLVFPRLSGVAPHANLIAYQVCYPGESGDPYAGCPESATLKAIDDAIADGADTLNFSIGGGEQNPWEDATAQAFLNAREAGIFVAVAAGNSGPYASSLGHVAPWETVVAASSHGRTVDTDPKLLAGMSGGDTSPPSDLTGASISDGAAGAIVWAGNLADPDPSDSYGPEMCAAPFPAGSLNGEIVVCQRGVQPRQSKAANVQAGGAAGFVLINDGTETDDTPIPDIYPLPGINLRWWDGQQLLTWLSSGSGHQASITASNPRLAYGPGDLLASWSSRGPSTTAPESLVPHVSAPGVDIYAANTTEHPFTQYPSSSDYTMMSGTSMATPHTTGAATLVRQARPDWSPAEVQSALMSTASETVKVQDYDWLDPTPAGLYDVGSGRIDVARAVNAGLIMDETADNYRNANPDNGGAVSELNIPQLANLSCRETCTWLRTVTAAADGAWTATAEAPELSTELSVYPSQFSLKKGQSQTVIVTAKVLDSSTPLWGSETEWHGKIVFTPASSLLPTQHWPVAVQYSHGSLPARIDIASHRNQGDYPIRNVSSKAYSQFTAHSFGLAAATSHKLTLKPDSNTNWNGEVPGAFDDLEDGNALIWVDVPEHTAQLVADTLDYPFNMSANAQIFVGQDINGDGAPDWSSEAICYSISIVSQNYCVINKPKAGRYWILVNNYDQSWPNPAPTRTFTVNTAVVPMADAGNMRLSGPASHDGMKPYDLNLHWDTAGLAKGDVLYGAFDLGTDADNAGNLGFIPVRLERGENDVSLSASQSRAKAGDIVHYRLNVLPNTTGLDRSFSLKTSLPDGLVLVPDSAKLTGSVSNGLNIDGQVLSLSGTQTDTSTTARSYAISTDAEDANCKTEESLGGGYIDLNQYGDFRIPVISGGTKEGYDFTTSQLFGDGDINIPLYNAGQNSGNVSINPAGFVNLDYTPWFNLGSYYHMADYAQPFQLMAVLQGVNPYWTNHMQTLYGNDADGNRTGVSLAIVGANQPEALLVQWDGTDTSDIGFCPWGGCTGTPDGNSFHYQLFARTKVDFTPGKPEVVFGYDKLVGKLPKQGAVGIRGYEGPMTSFGPLNDPIGTEYAFDNLDTKLKPHTLVCFDYHGPEQSQFALEFDARVSESATGQTLAVAVENGLEGSDTVDIRSELVVNGNLQVGAIADQETDEDSVLEGIEVLYSDKENSVNTIHVSGDDVSAIVHGDASGSTFDLVPEANWNGVTTVTVTVADKAHPSDSADTQFQLTVLPEADAPMAKAKASASRVTVGQPVTLDAGDSVDPDGGALSYHWRQTSGASVGLSGAETMTAGFTPTTAGSHGFELTVNNGSESAKAEVNITVIAAPSSGGDAASSSTGGGGGGAFGGLLLLLPLLRRKSR